MLQSKTIPGHLAEDCRRFSIRVEDMRCAGGHDYVKFLQNGRFCAF
ncbi:hypothetical protein J14TS5_49030 [Paenibacillus lautus]|nr:hypothetical protein J14TS5_49030 [Paenibacillus lautus]